MRDAKSKKKLTWLKVAISLSGLLLIAAHTLWGEIKIDAITLGLLTLVILPWLSELLESVEMPGGWKVVFRKIDKIESKQESHDERLSELKQAEYARQAEEIDLLKLLLFNVAEVTQLIAILRKFASGEPYLITGSEKSGLVRELRQLRDSGLVSSTPGRSIRSIPEGEADLKEFLKLTVLGKRFLELYEEKFEHLSTASSQEPVQE